jgi:hypothetical protein
VTGLADSNPSKRLKTVLEAQRANAARMTTAQLKRELHLAQRREDQPPIRQDWIAVLREELACR